MVGVEVFGAEEVQYLRSHLQQPQPPSQQAQQQQEEEEGRGAAAGARGPPAPRGRHGGGGGGRAAGTSHSRSEAPWWTPDHGGAPQSVPSYGQQLLDQYGRAGRGWGLPDQEMESSAGGRWEEEEEEWEEYDPTWYY